MKHLLIVLILLLALPVGAQLDSKQSQINIQRSVLKDLLAEDHISQFDYKQKMAALNFQEANVQKDLQFKPRTQGSKIGPAGTASVSGTVRVSGIGQSGVNVNVLDYNTRVYVGFATTNGMGAYTIADLAAGDYYLTINDYDDDYINAIWSSSGTEQCTTCQPDADNVFSLADAEVRIATDLDIVVGASVSGNVKEGVNNIDNLYLIVGTIFGSNDFTYSVGAYTDPSGNYTVSGLPAGDYYVMAGDSDDDFINAIWSSSGTEQCINCQPDNDNTITLADAENRLGVNLDLVVGATVTGQVIDQDTLAVVETLNARLFDSLGTTFYNFFQTVDGAGNYTFRGIPESAYKVYLESDIFGDNDHIPEIYNDIQCNACATLVYDGAGDSLVLVNGETTANIDFTVEKGASISGTILNNDFLTETVEQEGQVFVFNDSNRFLAAQRLNGTDVEPMADGQYKVGGLLPGMYFVQGGDRGREFFQRELFENIACPWTGCNRGGGGDPVVLGANEQRLGVNFLLNYGGKISGTVTDALTGLPISIVGNEYVQFYDSSGEVAGGALINADGTYIAARAIPPGSYSVRTGSMFNGVLISPYVMQKYVPGGNIDCPGVSCDLTAGNVTVTAYERQMPRDPAAEAADATVTGIDFALSPAFSFSGTITELGSATPLPDVHVLAYDAVGQFASWATTDEIGGFTVHGLPAGTYYALTNNGSNLPFMGLNQTAAGGWIDILFDGTPCPGSACDVTTGDPIVLGGGAVITEGVGEPVLDFSLTAGGTITGQVNIFGSLMPARYVNINVYNSDGVFYGSYPSDSSGYYMTAGVPEGSYYLTTSNDGALVDAKYGGEYCFTGSCDPLDATPVIITGNQSLIDVDFDLRTDYLFKNGLD